MVDSATATGTVIALQANFYWVQLDGDGQRLLCTQREKLKKTGSKAIVGDRVLVAQWQSERGVIAGIHERHTQLDRPPIANVNQIMVVFAAANPTLEPLMLSRFLVKAETIGVPVLLCINKCDLIDRGDLDQWQARLTAWGYGPLWVSSQRGDGLAELAQRLQDRVTVLAGHSGVGKSSLINALLPHLQLRVAAVSGKLQRGRHTTRHVELFELVQGGWIADTPGFNQPDLRCSPSEIAGYFPELRPYWESACQFSDCLHGEEPGCLVDRQWERYQHYRLLVTEAARWQQQQQQQRQAEAGWKAKDYKNQGPAATLEPRLAAKRYRRPSRRGQNQTLSTELTDVLQDD